MDKVTNRLFTQCNFPEWNKQKIHCKCEPLNNLSNVLLRNLNIENVYNFMLYGKQNWYYKAMEDVQPKKPHFVQNYNYPSRNTKSLNF